MKKMRTKKSLMKFLKIRAPFRLVSSPFLLDATIKFHLQKEGSPLAFTSLLQCHYITTYIATCT